MKILLSGVETYNKGAELMLYAILQEIERKYPNAKVSIAPGSIPQGLDYVKTCLKFDFWPYSSLLRKTHFNGVLRRLHLPEVEGAYFAKADYFLDGSGFLFSDQCKLWGTTPERWERLLKSQWRNGTKVVFLPQAFGPIEMDITKQAISSLGRYASLIMPRERQSYEYIVKSGLIDPQKLMVFTDFTSLVDGIIPSGFDHLHNGICIIPNMNMIYSGLISYEDYLKLLTSVIEEGQKTNHPVYLLNHEGKDDEDFAYKCQSMVNGEIEVVSNLNALEVKGIISTAYLVITSRFHGLASALNCCVPSLATSWSHKYEELYRDYEVSDSIMSLNNLNLAIEKLNECLDVVENNKKRDHLKKQLPKIQSQTRDMWEKIWNLK